MTSRALIAGATGLIGSNLANHLVSKGWEVYGVARKPQTGIPGVRPVAADLLEPESLRSALAGIDPTHVFFTTWVRRPSEEENIAVNGALVRKVLSALERSKSLKHVALVTGLKHYLGPFEMYAKVKLDTPLREEMPRLPYPNFFYAQEDALFEAAKRQRFTWSVHRSHTVIGYAIGNAMNMGVTLAVYATICRETGRPFVFPGSPVEWDGLTDVTDARLLARHLEWAATTPAARNQAFNIVNGDVFRWQWMWNRLAQWFEIRAAPYGGEATPLELQLADAAPIWADIARKYSLVEPNLDRLASAWHTDADLSRPIEVVTDMSKSRKLGFREYQATDESFFDLFSTLRQK